MVDLKSLILSKSLYRVRAPIGKIFGLFRVISEVVST